MREPLVVIVGRPNVGKSTLFNRLVGRRQAIVTDEPGVTRDRQYGWVRGATRPTRVADTGGIVPGEDGPYAREVSGQAARAIEEAACLLLVVDARQGPTPTDLELVGDLRRRGIPLLLVANKVDSPKAEGLVPQLYELGLGDPIPVSAEHGLGMDELRARLGEVLGPEPEESPGAADSPAAVRIAIVGRPNVGKSSLLNRLAGVERALVSEQPGTTRDTVDVQIETEGRSFRIVDTAGIRREANVRRAAERFSVLRAKHAIADSDVVLLVLDATRPVGTQDAHIAGLVQASLKPMVVVINKWDLVRDRDEAVRRWEEAVGERLRFVHGVPLAFVSARTGQRVGRLLDLAAALHRSAGRRLATHEVNRWLQRAAGRVLSHPAPGGPRLFYATQTGVHPPSFLVFCNDARKVQAGFRRHLDNSLREHFGLGATPVRLRFRSRRPPSGR